jgi:hypothetical protein
LGIGQVEIGQHLVDDQLQGTRCRGFGRTLHGRGDGRAQQHDAQIGVAAGDRPAGVHGRLDALAHAQAGPEQRLSSRLCAGDEHLGAHAVPGRGPTHVARFAHCNIELAGSQEASPRPVRRTALRCLRVVADHRCTFVLRTPV